MFVLISSGNQFGGQEPGSNEEVLAFARSKGAKFPVFAKLDVNGPNTHPLYAFLKANAPG
jgi:glutathione peroxidase